MAPDLEPHPDTWSTTNLVGVPAPLIASTAFNAHPVPMTIAGTREAHHGLFTLLDASATPADAAAVFEHYLALAFDLERGPAEGPRRWRASYLKLLQGWGADSNGPAGAVLKGWVESRFGLAPWFHKAPLARFPSPAWVDYLSEKASARYQNNAIGQQLDLLYEFCQWSLARWHPLGDGVHADLWRATTRVDEQLAAGTRRRGGTVTMRLNNVVSFALRREQADCFGDWLLLARVPLSKLLLYPGLLRSVALAGEGEVIAIGGFYEVTLSDG